MNRLATLHSTSAYPSCMFLTSFHVAFSKGLKQIIQLYHQRLLSCYYCLDLMISYVIWQLYSRRHIYAWMMYSHRHQVKDLDTLGGPLKLKRKTNVCLFLGTWKVDTYACWNDENHYNKCCWNIFLQKVAGNCIAIESASCTTHDDESVLNHRKGIWCCKSSIH